MRKTVVFFVLLTALACARAGVTRVPVPGAGWGVSFDSPPLQSDAIGPSAGNLLYRGSADRMIVSLHVGPPECPGGSTNKDMYRCFAARLAGLKGVVQDSIKAAETAKGVEVGYLLRVRNGERTVELFNVHLLFANRGSWGDLHVSVLQPQADDVPVVKGIVASVAVSP